MDPPTEGNDLSRNFETFPTNAIEVSPRDDVLMEPPIDLVEQPPNVLGVIQSQISENNFQDTKIEISDKLGAQVQDILLKNKELNIHPSPEIVVEQTQDLGENKFRATNVEDDSGKTQITFQPISKIPFKEFKKLNKPIRKYKEIPSDYPVGPRKYIRRKDKDEVLPARRIPKFIPDVNGNMWKVWGYPDVIELSTDSEQEIVEIPRGYRIDDDELVIEDPEIIRNQPASVYNKTAKLVLGFLLLFNLFKFGRVLFGKFKRFVSKKEGDDYSETGESSEEEEKYI